MILINSFRIVFASFIVISLSSCLADIDKGLMKMTNKISVIDPVTGKREISFESKLAEIKRANAQSAKILSDFEKKGVKIDAQNSQFFRVTRVFNKLKKVIHQADLPWEIHLIENKSWNAFTIGGGKIFVYTGLFEGKVAVRSDDELAAIIAHEIAHINARHASEKRGKLLISSLVDKRTKGNIYAASFTTVQENEADKYSVIYSALAGYNPSAGVYIWQRMDKYFGSKAKNSLYDHPLNEDRARKLTSYSNLAKRYYKAGRINQDYKNILQKNAVFTYNRIHTKRGGEGGGALSILEIFGNTYLESQKVKREKDSR